MGVNSIDVEKLRSQLAFLFIQEFVYLSKFIKHLFIVQGGITSVCALPHYDKGVWVLVFQVFEGVAGC